MRVIQITDPHVVVPPQKVSGRIDSGLLLQETVARINAELPKVGPVDAVLVTGDISDDGSPESYALFSDLMAPLDLPVFVIPGNHDQREPMRAAFACRGYLPASGRLDWSATLNGLHIVGLDTLVEGQGGGILAPETLGFLTQALKRAGSLPVLLAMHHPPFASGIRFMDSIGLEGVDSLAEVLKSSAADIRIVCGHVHCMMAGAVGGVTAFSGPATCSTFAADFRPDAPIGFMTAPGSYMIHDWAGAFRSIHIGTDYGDGPYSF